MGTATAPRQTPAPSRPPGERKMQTITGPSALGGGWRRFGNLTWLIAFTDFKLAFYGSALGYLWTFVRPLLFFGVLYLVFAVILSKFANGVVDFPVILLMNVVLITFFQEATGASIPSVVARENLVRKMHFPRLVIPLAAVTTSCLNLALNLVAVFVFTLIYGVEPRATWLLIPLALIPLLLLTVGFAMMLSSLYVRYRDVAPIWGVISQILFYACPVFYTIEQVAKKGFARPYLFNPIAVVMQQIRFWLVGGTYGAPTFMGGKVWLLVPFGIVIVILAFGYRTFSRMAPEIAEEL